MVLLAEPRGLKALQATVMRNADAQKGGSKFILGFSASLEDLREVQKLFDGSQYQINIKEIPLYYKLDTQELLNRRVRDSVPLYRFQILAEDDKLINAEKFEQEFGVTVHMVSTPEGFKPPKHSAEKYDAEQTMKSEAQARNALAQSVKSSGKGV